MKEADKAADAIEEKTKEERHVDKITLGLQVEKLYFDKLKRKLEATIRLDKM